MSEQGQGQDPGQTRGRKVNDFISDATHHRTDPDLIGHTDAVREFIQTTVIPGFQATRASLEGNGREVRIVNSQHNAAIVVAIQGRQEFSFTVRAQVAPDGVRPIVETTGAHGGQRNADGNPWGDGWLERHHLSEITPDAVAEHVLAAYTANTNTAG